MKTWRVGHQGRDRMYYEELHGGAWERIDIDGEMLMGRAHHVIYFASPERWLEYPEWARGRRDEIIARITSEFREPDYETRAARRRSARSVWRQPRKRHREVVLELVSARLGSVGLEENRVPVGTER